MARINIEDQIFKDGRFLDLAIDIGCKYKAMGVIVFLWAMGQEYWKKDKSLIPKHLLESHPHVNSLINCNFIQQQEHGFYVSGAEKHFDWLLVRTESARKAGIASGKSRRSNSNDLQRTKTNQTQPNATKTNPPTLTPTLLNPTSGKASTVSTEQDSSTVRPSLTVDFVLNSTAPEVWARWNKQFGEQYVNSEVLKLYQQLLENPASVPKTPRGWIKTIGGWLQKGLELTKEPKAPEKPGPKGRAKELVDLFILAGNKPNPYEFMGAENYRICKEALGLTPYDLARGSVEAKFKRGAWIDAIEAHFAKNPGTNELGWD